MAGRTGTTGPTEPAGPGAPARGASGATSREGPRRDTRGIVHAPSLLARVRFRRRLAAAPLRHWVEHYWLIDWHLDEPHVSQVVPHPCVNLVFERRGPAGVAPEEALVTGVHTGVFTTRLEGTGRVCGVLFRPGGFRPFLAPSRPLTSLMRGRQLGLEAAFGPVRGGTDRVPGQVLRPADEDGRVAALDSFLSALAPRPDPTVDRAMALADRIRSDRSVLRVEQLAREEDMSQRSLQRLFAAYVGVSPKWAILRYRVHEAMEQAATRPTTDWATLAAELGYSDQAHLVRDFTAAVGISPAAYARAAGSASRP